MEVALTCKALFVAGDGAFEALCKLWDIAIWLGSCCDFLKSGDISEEDCQNMQKGFRMHLATLKGLSFASGFAESPFMKPKGAWSRKMCEVIHEAGRNKLALVRNPIVAALGHVGAEALAVEDGATEAVRSLAEANLSEDMFNSAVSWATSVGDSLLVQQLYYMHNVHHVAKAIAAAELVVRGELAAATIGGRKINNEQVSTLKALRARRSVFAAFSAEHKHIDLFPAENSDPFHIKLLHGIVSPPAFLQRVDSETSRITAVFREVWSADLKRLRDDLETRCPAWAHLRESFLSNPEVVEALCGNPKYGSIGVLAGEVRMYVKMIKGLHSDRQGMVVPVELLSSSAQTADHGVETVAVTFFAYTVTKEFVKLKNQVLINNAIRKLTDDLKPTGISLTTQMSECLEKWGSGAMLLDDEQATTASHSTPAKSVQESPRHTGSPPALAAAVPPAALSAAPSLAAGEPCAAANAAASPKRSLAERARQAKRRCAQQG